MKITREKKLLYCLDIDIQNFQDDYPESIIQFYVGISNKRLDKVFAEYGGYDTKLVPNLTEWHEKE